MKRHVIVGHLGLLDRPTLAPSSDENTTYLDFVKGDHSLAFGIGDALLALGAENLFPTEVALDLLVLAAQVHAADTRISRSQESQDSWTREIRLVVPVSDPVLWLGATNTIETMLGFLTGDRWGVRFRQRPGEFQRIISPRQALIPHEYDCACLFSGGLDSLIGAIDLLESGRHPLLISHAGEGAASKAQEKLFDQLKRHYGTVAFQRLRLWMTFPHGLVDGVALEDSTRGRSFLFFALGVFGASSLGSTFELLSPENGFIALNVPLDSLRLGSNSTRTTHPFYIARWNELLMRLGLPGRIRNPYWNRSKGTMVFGCANATLLRSIVGDSLSCASPTKSRWAGHPIEHCGYCLPCLIRRAALEAAWQPGNDPTTYTVQDLTTRSLSAGAAEGVQIRSVQVLLARVRRQPSLVSLLIHKPGSLEDVRGDIDALADVFREGLHEVENLLANVHTTAS